MIYGSVFKALLGVMQEVLTIAWGRQEWTVLLTTARRGPFAASGAGHLWGPHVAWFSEVRFSGQTPKTRSCYVRLMSHAVLCVASTWATA